MTEYMSSDRIVLARWQARAIERGQDRDMHPATISKVLTFPPEHDTVKTDAPTTESERQQ